MELLTGSLTHRFFGIQKVDPPKRALRLSIRRSRVPFLNIAYINELLTHTFHSSVRMQKTRLTSFINSPNQNYQPKISYHVCEGGITRMQHVFICILCEPKKPTNFYYHEKHQPIFITMKNQFLLP